MSRKERPLSRGAVASKNMPHLWSECTNEQTNQNARSGPSHAAVGFKRILTTLTNDLSVTTTAAATSKIPVFMCCVPRMSSSKVMSIPSLCHGVEPVVIPAVRGPMLSHDLKKRELVKKVTSVRKGLLHIQQCHDSHRCDKALCKSTRRLVDQYRTHACVSRSTNSLSPSNSPYSPSLEPPTSPHKCQVCMLWTLVTGNPNIIV
ncbi:hypothetical protein DYB37_008016 [Aphanomyces astaci]|uniref:Uncharacterized protein n=1 Tax=Aphanomyces astaci TaxID=112090 RepID=A0A3R6YWK8_APHAT|nr:hypothetical protein DYB37_008016 [Aphanomyces astaci]